MKLPVIAAWAGLLILLSTSGCLKLPENTNVSNSDSTDNVPIVLTDVTRAAGVRFTHRNGAMGRKHFVELFSGGCAFLDYDSDGWQDIFLPQGAPLPGYRASTPLR